MTPDFDLSKCKDVEFARNLIAQMNGHAIGRRNSVRDLEPQSPRYAVPREGQSWLAQVIQQRPWGTVPDARVRLCKPSWQECDIGDFVEAKNMLKTESPYLILRIANNRGDTAFKETIYKPFIALNEWLFQKVVTLDNEVFWKRIE